MLNGASSPLTFLFSLERLGMKFGLENISRLCEALDHPERAFRSVIVAGTNGKGSVTAMTETALRAAGHRTARYTSPHLLRVEERFVIDGRDVETPELIDALARVQGTCQRLVNNGVLQDLPTFFEVATATAFELFRRAFVEIAVLEVGLGGRLDSTNVVTPIAAAITSIDFDHQAQLGDTIASIAREKAGVIKRGIPVVCGPLPEEAAHVIRQVVAECHAQYIAALDEVTVTRRDGRVDIRSRDCTLEDVDLALRGDHQISNAAVVVRLLSELRRLGISMDDDAVRAGLTNVAWPGRLERVVSGETEFILDAAHNPAGAAALARHLVEIGWTDVVLVFGAMQDKDVRAMLTILAPVCRRIVCTTPASPRAMAVEELASIAAAVAPWPIDAVASPEAAIVRAQQAGSRVVIAGSIFLIGPLRGILR